ncbi:hypothetical protein BS78_K267700 [Paspalum vaginatum]|uniref:Uncharacterized protein n=1 Tax=Paspalum vaginatum TaxID=158149 RepID=A0A9W7XAY4_9POAL|nr:hypothetical protein BS78_K267700 [Paspalum vaginatum]
MPSPTRPDLAGSPPHSPTASHRSGTKKARFHFHLAFGSPNLDAPSRPILRRQALPGDPATGCLSKPQTNLRGKAVSRRLVNGASPLGLPWLVFANQESACSTLVCANAMVRLMLIPLLRQQPATTTVKELINQQQLMRFEDDHEPAAATSHAGGEVTVKRKSVSRSLRKILSALARGHVGGQHDAELVDLLLRHMRGEYPSVGGHLRRAERSHQVRVPCRGATAAAGRVPARVRRRGPPLVQLRTRAHGF